MRHFPVFLDLTTGPVVLVGSGPAALSKLRLLRAADARVRWYRDDAAPRPTDPSIEVFPTMAPEQVDLSDAVAVIAADEIWRRRR
jgi:uroporphyrin-III C-methyltransferase / precorrin-2 dehydrogenase / sirohydrochlorin ferrochelatase